jgi:hypothetical protein
MWATADLISAAGCENVHIRCEATDVAYMLGSYSDGGRDLTAANRCLREKCPVQAAAADAAGLPAGSGKPQGSR